MDPPSKLAIRQNRSALGSLLSVLTSPLPCADACGPGDSCKNKTLLRTPQESGSA